MGSDGQEVVRLQPGCRCDHHPRKIPGRTGWFDAWSWNVHGAKTLGSGERNNLTIDRLKDKLGTRSMPSGEVTLNRAHALQVGELDRGFRQMAEMVNTSRLSNAMRSSALMRRAVREAVEHSKSRVVFGKSSSTSR